MKNLILLFVLGIFNIQVWSQNALSFDGTNDRVDCGNNSSVQISGTQITIEAWVMPTSFGPNNWSNNIVDKESWSPQQGYMLRTGDNGKVNFNLGATNTWNELTTSTAVLAANTWAHVAATYDGSYMRIYINGVCTDSIAKNISFSDASAYNLVIGDNSQVGRNFAGKIDEVRIWDIARTKAQLQSTMNTEICGGVSGLRAYYRFNQGIAGSSNSGITTAINNAVGGTNASLSGFSMSGTTSNFVLGQALSQAAGGVSDTVFASICNGQSYSFGGQTLTTAGTYNATLISSGGCDSNVTLHLAVNNGISNTIYDTICQGEAYIFNGQSLTTAGTYTANLTRTNGCDSTVFLLLEIRNINTNVNVFSTGLTSLATGAQYQWLNCPNMDTIGLYNQTSATLNALSNGSYAVIIDYGACSDTSSCYSVTGVGISNSFENSSLRIFPNPSSKGIFKVQFNSNTKITYKVLDILGNEILKGKAQENFELNLSGFQKGIYFIRMDFNVSRVTRKLILQ